MELLNAGLLTTRCANDCLVVLLGEVSALAPGDVPGVVDAALLAGVAGEPSANIEEGRVEGHALDLLPRLLASLPDDFRFSTAESHSVLAGVSARVSEVK